MKSSGLIIAAVVLAALTGVLYWSNHHPPSGDTTKASLDTPPKILALKQEDISKIAIRKKGGQELDLAKGDAGKWQITAPKLLGSFSFYPARAGVAQTFVIPRSNFEAIRSPWANRSMSPLMNVSVTLLRSSTTAGSSSAPCGRSCTKMS